MPIRYITFHSQKPTGSPQRHYIDDLSVNLAPTCINRLNITPKVQTACIGAQAIVDFEFCLTGPLPTPTDVTLTIPLNPGYGITYGNGGGFTNGSTTISGMITDQCVTRRLVLNLPNNFSNGQTLSFSMDVEMAGACWENHGTTTFEVKLSDCCALPFSADFTFSMDCGAVWFNSAPSTAALTHAWDFDGNGTIESTVANPVHTYSASGTYTVVHTVTNLCGVSAVESKFITIDCDVLPSYVCPCATLNIDASRNLKKYSELEAIFNYDKNNDGVLDRSEHSGCIAIKGSLEVDIDIKIIQADIKMQPCSEIVVLGTANPANTHRLALNKNNIYGCNAMWKGITVQSGAALDMVNNPLVADAENAVMAFASPIGSNAKTQLGVQNNHFRRNHIGVHIAPPPSGLSIGTVSQTPFVGNTFEAEGLLPACGTRPANYQSAIGYAGVLVRGAAFTVGAPGGAGFSNTFNQLRLGVVGESVILRVHRAKFSNMAGTFSSAAPTSGVGVLGRAGSQEVRNSRFEDCAYGIYSENAMLRAEDNSSDRVDIAVDLLNPSDFDIVRNSDFYFREYGVRARGLQRRNVPVGGVLVPLNHYLLDYNTFRSQGSHNGPSLAAAVRLENAGGSADMPTQAQISRNYVNVQDRVAGFVIANQNKWKIADNFVEFYRPTGSSAIEEAAYTLFNSRENYLYDNRAHDISDVTPASLGFSVAIGQGNLFCCNETYKTRQGAYFSGSCTGTQYRHNTMDEHENPVYLDPATTISWQGFPDDPLTPVNEAETYANRFLDGSGTAVHAGGQFEAQLSTFYVTNESHPHWPDGVDPQEFFKVNGATASTCEQDPSCPPQEYEDDEYQSMTSDPATAQGTFGAWPQGEALQWESERELYARLKNSPALLGASAAVDAFFAAKDAGSALKTHHEADQTVAETDAAPAAWAQTLQAALDSIAQGEQTAQGVLAALSAATNWADSLALYWQAEGLRAQTAPYIEVFLQVQRQMDSLRRVKALAALPMVLALPESNVLQTNRKTAHKIYLEWRASGSDTLTAAQFAEVSPIAHQCPRTGGAAVYLARSLYQIQEAKAFDDGTLCAPIEERSAAAKPRPQAKAVLWPNPGNGSFNLWLPGVPIAQTAQVQVTDLSGKTLRLFDVQLVGGNAVVDATFLPPGMYLCRVNAAGQTWEPLKFIVSK